MGMIKIKETRLNASSLSSFEYLPRNPNSRVRTIQVRFSGKLINFDFDQEEDADITMDYLLHKLPDFIRISESKWLKTSYIKRYDVMPDFFKIKINGESHFIKMKDREAFNEMVEFLDKSFL